MTDYTPTTEEVRAAYEGQLIKIGENRFEFIDETQANSEFDRWLNEVKAQTISDAIDYLKTTPAVTLTGKGGGYELLESYLMGEEQ